MTPSTQSIWLLLTLLSVLALAGCGGEEKPKPIGEGYVGTPNAVLRDRLGAGSTIVGRLPAGERVEIFQRRRNWARVATAGGAEGWMLESNIIARDVYEKAQQIVKEAAGLPSQGKAKAHNRANLHMEPARSSPSLYQLEADEECEVVAHQATLPPGVKAPAPEAAGAGGTEAQPAAAGSLPGRPAAKKSRRAAAKPAGPRMDDWFMVRGANKAGWVLARSVEMTIPDEVAQYSEGRAITAWHVLNEVQDGPERKAQYVWATSSERGSQYAFDAIRVFVWNTARDRYETAYRERNLRGVYPLLAGRETVKAGEVPSFTVTTLDEGGNKVSRTFVMIGTVVRRREQVE